MILGSAPQVNETLWQQGLAGYPSSLSEGLSAAIDSTLSTNPFAELRRMAGRAFDYVPTDDRAEIMIQHSDDPAATRAAFQEYKNRTVLSGQKATEEYGIPGHLAFSEDIPEKTAAELNQLKRDELQRQFTAARSPGGFFRGAAEFGVSIGASALDPLNIASAFVPIVGEARYALWAASLGKPVARAVKGAIEGVVGAALVEPIVYAGTQQEQADYHAVDSLLNLTFGGLIGATLHTGAGAFGDLMNQRASKIHQAAIRDAIAAVVDNRPVEVESMLRSHLLSGTADVESPAGIVAKLNKDRVVGGFSRAFDDFLPSEFKMIRRFEAEPDFANAMARESRALDEQLVKSQRDLETVQGRYDLVKASKNVIETAKTEIADVEARLPQAKIALDIATAQATRRLERANIYDNITGADSPETLLLAREQRLAQEVAADKKVKAADIIYRALNAKVQSANETIASYIKKIDDIGIQKGELGGARGEVARSKTSIESFTKMRDDYVSGRMAQLQEEVQSQLDVAMNNYIQKQIELGIGQRPITSPEAAMRSEIERLAGDNKPIPKDGLAEERLKSAEETLAKTKQETAGLKNLLPPSDLDAINEVAKAAEAKAALRERAFRAVAACEVGR